MSWLQALVPAMPRALRSTAKRLAQTLFGQEDVRSFIRLKRLWLSKQIYRRPIAVAELRHQLIDLGDIKPDAATAKYVDLTYLPR